MFKKITYNKLEPIYRKIIVVFLVILLCVSFLPTLDNTVFAEDDPQTIKIEEYNGKPCSGEEILIKFKPNTSSEMKSNTLDAKGSSFENVSATNVVKAKIPDGKTLDEFLDEMNASPDVEYAQPNYVYNLNLSVNDPLINLPTNDPWYQWHHDTINSFEAWDTTTGTGTIVAVLDTGLDLDHSDFVGQVLFQTDTADDDGNAEDDHGHGTHVSGIVLANEDNSIMGAGVAPNSKLIIVDVFLYYFDAAEQKWVWGAFTNDVIDGINYAVTNGADVINMSLGGYNDDTLQNDAVAAAVNNDGVVVVCSAGNDATSTIHYPSDIDEAISVISTDRSDTISSFSNFGPEKDISAPGGSIISTYIDDSYANMGGTSMASPVVAGVCALILSADPTLTVAEVKTILYETADDLGDAGKDDYYGWGRVNAHLAVLYAADRPYKVTLDDLDVELGYTGELNETVLPTDATNKNVTWSSDTPAIATVSTLGVVTGEALGSAVITVTTEDGSFTDTCTVNVNPVAVTSVELNKDTTSIVEESTEQLNETVYPVDAANKAVSWTSDDTDIATVSSSGLVTAVAIGEADITVTTDDGNFTDICVVTVTADPLKVASVTLDRETLSIQKNATPVTLVATVAPETATNKDVTWSSSSPSIATVSSSGLVTTVSVGETTITVETDDGGFTDTCVVTVTPDPTEVASVSLDRETLFIQKNDTPVTLVATVAPETATTKTVTWSSSSPSIATVSSSGLVTTVSVGETTITVTTDDGGFTDTCLVTVTADPDEVASVSLNITTMSLEADGSSTLTATVAPETALDKSITWSSSAPSIASVSNGVVTAESEGTATITVTTVDGGFTDTCEVTVAPIVPVTISETIRVKLSLNSPTTVPIYIDGNFDISQDGAVSLERQLYTVKLEENNLNLYYGSTFITGNTTLTFVQHSPSSGQNNFIWLDNYEHGPCGYFGNLEFTISGSEIVVINHIYLEEYLYGVVPHEMSDSWPAEALKSQAIAARTYAASQMGVGSYDLGDTSGDQVYKGFNSANVNSIAAINATSKIVLQDKNALSPTYYAASNGGYTDIPYHVWGSGIDMPFDIVADPYDVANPSSPYEKIFFPEVMADEVNSITTSDNVSGTPNKSNALQYIKEQILASGQLQSEGYDVTNVNDFTLEGVLALVPHTHDTDGGSEDHGRMPASGTNDCIDFIMATGTFKIEASKSGVPSTYDATAIELDLRYFDGANGDDTYKVFNMSSLRLFVIDDEGDGFAIYHRRYGHGVGMSQRGAQQRADDGQAYSQILSFYYPGTSTVAVDITKTALTSMTAPVDNSNAEVVCNDYLNVRSGAGTGYSILGTLPAGAKIQVTTPFTTADWHIINYGTVSGYVHKDYVTLASTVSVTGVSLDTNTATLNIGSKKTLIATITPENATNKNVIWTTSNESFATVSLAGEITGVAQGSAIITVTTSDGAFTDTCSVTITSTVAGEITSSVYTVDQANSILYDVADETTIATLKTNLDNDEADIKIFDSDDNEITDINALVGTGMKVKLVVNDIVDDELEVCVMGDVSSDGLVDITDVLYLRAHIIGTYTIENVYAISAELSGDAIIDITDILYIRAHIIGTYDIHNN